MQWQGSELKQKMREAGITQAALAETAGVTRHTVMAWIHGQVPKGTHLLAISRLLGVAPDALFSAPPSPVGVAPLHRRRRNAKITPEMQTEALRMAEDYAPLISAETLPIMQQVARGRSDADAQRLATRMRELARLGESDDPMDFEHTFHLMNELQVCVIPRPFPELVKDYAFYTRINEQRVVFVNSATSTLDIIFPLLHETVHAVRERDPSDGYDKAEEDFCDKVAGLVQFPDDYVETAWLSIRGRHAGTQVNLLKELATRHHHTVYGLVKRIEERRGRKMAFNVHGADGNLRSEHRTIGDVLYADGAESFVEIIEDISPIWFRVVLSARDTLTDRRLAEVLGIESVLDAREVRRCLDAAREREANVRSL